MGRPASGTARRLADSPTLQPTTPNVTFCGVADAYVRDEDGMLRLAA